LKTFSSCLFRVACAAALLVSFASAQSPTVRTGYESLAPPADESTFSLTAPCATLDARAWHGQLVPGGGTLSPIAFANPATMGGDGRIAFMANVDGSARNQGIFVADAAGLHPVAMGCGGGGGSGAHGSCGDPSPIGGSFAGFFGGTFFAPSINASGDVLFFADILGGSSSRGLFLWRAATGAIAKVAVIGDASPLGGTFTQVGPGSLGDGGEAVFIAKGAGPNVNIFRWKGGVLSKVAAVGDAAPGGGTIAALGTESVGFVDGTNVPVGPLPAVNALGQIAYRAVVGSEYRMIVDTAGSKQLYLASSSVPPGGGSWVGFEAPHLNAWGEIAFFADFQPTPGNFNSGLFVGKPGAWRKAVVFFDPLPDGGICFGMAITRNPMTPLDDAGNLAFWTSSQHAGGVEIEGVFVSRADGTLAPLVGKGQATPLGGTLGFFQSWISQRSGAVAVSASTPGAPGVLSAHFELDHALTWEDHGHALAGSAGLPRLRGEGSLAAGSAGALRLISAKPSAPAWLLVGTSEVLLPFKGGVLVPDAQLLAQLFVTTVGGTLDLPWSSWPAGVPGCTTLLFQAWIVDAAGPKGAAASNGVLGRTP
jgi:hypothetical protein